MSIFAPYEFNKKIFFLPMFPLNTRWEAGAGMILLDCGKGKTEKQAGAELCQAQAQVCLPAEGELILMLPSWRPSSIFSKLC